MGLTVCLRPIDMVSRLINCQHSCNRPDSGVPSTPPGKRIAELVKRFEFPGPLYPHVMLDRLSSQFLPWEVCSALTARASIATHGSVASQAPFAARPLLSQRLLFH
mgnify:CR=1 FL=1